MLWRDGDKLNWQEDDGFVNTLFACEPLEMDSDAQEWFSLEVYQ